jgi:hypothetical protein
MKETCLPPEVKIVGNITIGDNIKCDIWGGSSVSEEFKIITQKESPVLSPIQSVTKGPISNFMYFFNEKHYTDVYPDVIFYFNSKKNIIKKKKAINF